MIRSKSTDVIPFPSNFAYPQPTTEISTLPIPGSSDLLLFSRYVFLSSASESAAKYLLLLL